MNFSEKQNDRKKVLLGEKELKTPVLCAPVIGKDLKSMKYGLQKTIDQGADIVELRIDKLENYVGWKEMLNSDIPKIVTNRAQREGGFFQGDEDERISMLLKAISAGVSAVDIEFSTDEKNRSGVLKKAEKNNTSTIISFHDFDKFPNPENLLKKAEAMTRKGDIGKAIGYAETYEDALRSLEFLIKCSKKIDKPIISFAMGKKGQFTRLVSPLLNSPITYASIGEKTAPGQLNLKSTKKILSKFRQ